MLSKQVTGSTQYYNRLSCYIKPNSICWFPDAKAKIFMICGRIKKKRANNIYKDFEPNANSQLSPAAKPVIL